MLTPETLPDIQAALAAMGIDGWLLFDFRGTNPIASAMLRLEGGLVTRRCFGFIPTRGVPVALTHAIEQLPWRLWPSSWQREIYSGWRQLEALLAKHIRGKRVAMEYSPGDSIPYLDRIPAGVIEMVRAAGATVVTSADLVSRFYAQWTPAQIASHRRAAEAIAEIARNAFSLAGAQTLSEFELAHWIRDAFARGGLVTDHGPIVAIGPNAANPHYEPLEGQSALITPGNVLLIDLFAHEPEGVFADQTWVGTLGAPDTRTTQIWEAVRDARDAAIGFLRTRLTTGQVVRGMEADDAARDVITARGFGPNFWHRTGHSIDAYEIHGSGPHLDHLESRDDRALIPGVAFSIEPGIYLPGQIGVRSEVNAVVGDADLLVTPAVPQRDLFVV